MGDRATISIIQHRPDSDEHSPVLYLHWNGSYALDLIREAAPGMRKGDVSYAFARLVGHAHTVTSPGSALGMGVWSHDWDNDGVPDVGDNGHFTIDIGKGTVTHEGRIVLEDLPLAKV